MTFREMIGDWFHPTVADMLAKLEERTKNLETRVLQPQNPPPPPPPAA